MSGYAMMAYQRAISADDAPQNFVWPITNSEFFVLFCDDAPQNRTQNPVHENFVAAR